MLAKHTFNTTLADVAKFISNRTRQIYLFIYIHANKIYMFFEYHYILIFIRESKIQIIILLLTT